MSHFQASIQVRVGGLSLRPRSQQHVDQNMASMGGRRPLEIRRNVYYGRVGIVKKMRFLQS